MTKQLQYVIIIIIIIIIIIPEALLQTPPHALMDCIEKVYFALSHYSLEGMRKNINTLLILVINKLDA